MKKFFTLIILSICIGANAQTVIYGTAFAGGIGSWTTVRNSGNPNEIWKYHTGAITSYYSGSTTFASATASNGFMLFMSDSTVSQANGGDNGTPEDADLLSPVINCSTQNFVFLEFDEFFAQANASSGSVYVSNDGATWNQVYGVSNTTANAEHVVVDITQYAANQATVYLKFNYQGNWDYYWALDDIKLVAPVGLDISVDTITMSKYVSLGSQTVTGTVTNRGGTTINSFDLNYTDNGGAPVSQHFSGLTIAPLASYDFTFTQPIVMNTAIQHTIVVTSSSPNSGTDLVSSNDSWTDNVITLSSTPVKNVLLEEFTTAQCQYCPDGTTRLRHILENNTNMIGAALHAGFGTDAMTTADHSTLATSYTDFAPAVMVDRVYYESEGGANIAYYNDPYDRWEPYAQARKTVTTPVSIIASNTYDSTNRQLTVNAAGKFYSAITDNFRLNCYIIEDSVTGTGSGYNQVNGSSNDATSEWYQKGSPIVGFEHRHVVRQMLGGPWGSTGVIDATTTDGGIYSKQYTYTLPSTWRDSKITVVVLVQHYATNKYDREILNAMEMPLNTADSTGIVSAVNEISGNPLNSIKLYPNPASDVVNINFSLGANSNLGLDVYDVVGKLITSQPNASLRAGDYSTKLNTADFNNGIYFVAVKDGNKVVQTLKFIISK